MFMYVINFIGNAEGSGVDFSSNTLTAVFRPGDSRVNVSMPITMDRLFEPSEVLGFSLTVPSNFSDVRGRLLVKPGINNIAEGVIMESSGNYNVYVYACIHIMK